MTGLIDDYLREVEAGLRIEPARRAQVVDELRSHLREKVEERLRAQPDRPLGEIEREVLHEAGSPRDLALAYEPDGLPVLVNRAGDTVVRLGKAVGRGAGTAARAVGRGTGRVLKGVAIAVGVLLLVALVAGAWAFHELKPYALAAAEESQPAWAFSQTCWDVPCDVAGEAQRFHVGEGMRHVRFLLDLRPVSMGEDLATAGNVTVTITDAEGRVAYARNLSLSPASSVHQEAQWAAMPGNWTASVSATGLVGQVSVRAYVSSGPWSAVASLDGW